MIANYDPYYIMVSHKRYLAGQKETVHYGFLDQVWWYPCSCKVAYLSQIGYLYMICHPKVAQ
jgi:hypothetical protein